MGRLPPVGGGRARRVARLLAALVAASAVGMHAGCAPTDTTARRRDGEKFPSSAPPPDVIRRAAERRAAVPSPRPGAVTQ